MIAHVNIAAIMASLRPNLKPMDTPGGDPTADYYCSEGFCTPLRANLDLPTQAQVDAEGDRLLVVQSQAATTRAARRTLLLQLVNGSGNLTAAQLTTHLRNLAREILED